MLRVIGIDEVGRGCLAGPLVIGAVMLEEPIDGLKDSKLLSKNKRQKLDVIIKETAETFALGWVSPKEVDDLGLTKATKLAIDRAMEQIDVDYDEIIIDGSLNFLSLNPKSRALIKADQTVPCVSAASIIAKVARDNYMTQVARTYPDYAFEKHVGYGTKLHLDLINTNGTCDLHRLSFKPLNLISQGQVI